MTDAPQLGLFGRTSSVPSAAIVGTTSLPSSIRWANSGRWTSSGECWMHSTTEFLNADAVSLSSLALILEPQVDPKYFLSERACAGILRRAMQQGKTLPEGLQEALQAVVKR